MGNSSSNQQKQATVEQYKSSMTVISIPTPPKVISKSKQVQIKQVTKKTQMNDQKIQIAIQKIQQKTLKNRLASIEVKSELPPLRLRNSSIPVISDNANIHQAQIQDLQEINCSQPLKASSNTMPLLKTDNQQNQLMSQKQNEFDINNNHRSKKFRPSHQFTRKLNASIGTVDSMRVDETQLAAL